ncbi:MAG: hypothetical protein KatS3mg118_2324 [Paracoccaceae bacterium]|nr:MAG: hypothetical protein KatS3mg118_2324 [Paracoccaceae bacterium]
MPKRFRQALAGSGHDHGARRAHARGDLSRTGRPSRGPLSRAQGPCGADRDHPASRSALWRDDEQQGGLSPALCLPQAGLYAACASTSAASAAARASSTRAWASCRTPPPRSTIIQMPCTPTPGTCWVAGFSFGAWIGMQLLMRRPEIAGFVAVSPPANHVRLLLPRALPRLGADRQRRRGPDRAARAAVAEARRAAPGCRRGSPSPTRPSPGPNHFFDAGAGRSMIDAVSAYVEQRMIADGLR